MVVLFESAFRSRSLPSSSFPAQSPNVYLTSRGSFPVSLTLSCRLQERSRKHPYSNLQIRYPYSHTGISRRSRKMSSLFHARKMAESTISQVDVLYIVWSLGHSFANAPENHGAAHYQHLQLSDIEYSLA